MKIVAIGGGEIGRPGTKIETLSIDRQIVSMAGKKHPKLLFLPTASNDSEGYVKVVEKYFGNKLGCRVEPLLLYGKKISGKELRRRVLAADIIYVGGGNTFRMLKLWRKVGLDKVLIEAARKGKVLAGVSAGAICWFRFGNSDSRKMIDPKADYIRVRGLSLYPIFLAPHFDAEKDRQGSLKRMLKGTRQIAIALDNCSALCVNGNQYEVLASKRTARAYRCYWKDGKYYRGRLQTRKPLPILNLTRAT
ncbi:MAG TPA: peptidase E [Candidatus Paceibacterota bacterium]|nr:peptidase E [Candidatus Paceibacterota bacterium]